MMNLRKTYNLYLLYYFEMSKFTREQQLRFEKDLQAINLDSDSELEDSFYGKEMARLQSQLSQLKSIKKEDPILTMMKQNIQNQNKMIAQYQNQVTQLRRITHNEQKNVIDQTVLEEIKNRVAINANQSVLHLADQQYNMSVVRQSLLQQKQMQGSKVFGKKKGFLQEIQKQQQLLKKRFENANAEREHLAMQQEDKLSMKYELDSLSKLFSQRFLQPKLRKLQQKDCKVRIVATSIKGTFTNLTPEIVNQANILPKNSPQIALKLLRNNKRKSLKSISQTNVKLQPKKFQNNPQSFEEVQTQVNQVIKGQLIQNLEHHFVQYITYINGFLGSLSEISKNYSPKFLKFLDEKQKNINYQFNESQITGKEKIFSQVASLQNSKQLKQIKLTLESITNLSGLEHFTNIEEAQLQFNSINMIKPIQSCKKLIQINLSYNKLKSIASISHLPWLRLLNIQHNLVSELKLPCRSLQIVWGGHNLIEDVDLNQSKYLRILILNNNKLNELPRLRLHNLQELNLNRNQLRSLKNLQQLILLKKLSLSHNRFETIDEKLTFLYLNQLNLSHNYIKKLNIFFLPCLEKLYLNNNKIAGRSNTQLYLPNLKELNLDENRLEGFSPIWQLLLHSRKLQYIRYSNNQYFLNLREKTRQIFEYFIYKHMDNAKIINENQMDIGIKKYYESNYDIYYHGIKFFKENSILIKSIENNINFILQEFNFAGDLQKNKKSFIKQKQYIYYQSIRKIKQLQQIVSFVKQYPNKGNNIISINSSLFFHFDEFQINKRNLYHSVRTLVVKKRYRKKQRSNYFVKNEAKICQLLKQLTQLHLISEKQKSVFKFKYLLRGLTQNQAVIKIQKVWRGYVRRKLYKKLKQLKNHKSNSDSDFQDVDTDFFNQQLQRHQFDITSIEGLDFQQLIIRPDVFQYIQNKQRNEKGQKLKEQQKQAALTAQQKKHMVNNFLDSRTKLKNNQKKPVQQQQQPVQWGITDPRLLKTLQYKQQKKAQVRRKEQQKLMTAAERLQKFRRGGR